MKYSTLLFDLDGTLVDSSPGMVDSLKRSLDFYQIEHAGFDFKTIIGPPLAEGLNKFNKELFQDQELLTKVSKLYREHYGQEGVYVCEPYQGIKELLVYLKNNNAKLAVATLKPTLFAEKMLAHHGLSQYFDFILGTAVEQISVNKAEIVESVLNFYPHVVKPNTVMIGDGIHDVHGAHKNDIDVIGVTYGFGKHEDLTAAKPTHVVHSVAELQNYLI